TCTATTTPSTGRSTRWTMPSSARARRSWPSSTLRSGKRLEIGVTPGPRRGVVLATLCLGVLIAQIDTSVVNLAVRPIGAALGVGVAALQWVLDAYNLAYALLLLTGGLLGDLYGRKRTFIAGVAVFSLGCLCCGLAP